VVGQPNRLARLDKINPVWYNRIVADNKGDTQMTKQDGFMVINLTTAECEIGFATREQAEAFINETGVPELTQAEWENEDFDMGETERTLIMPYYINDTDEPNELTLYSNWNRHSKFSSVADYYEDTLNDDFISTQDTPVRIQLAI